MIQAKIGLNWPSGFRGEDFWKSLQTDDRRMFDNNFLFFVTVTAMLDDSQRSSITILKEDHICILSIWFDCIWLFTGF